ncbi:MAG: 2-C-methyl-D-erythritol 4-phosphate cytidylyltransferase [Clostridia bacterium]|nr:2-C-methyl-D-erythritol 4-phosphate cytidylyltransferase [Clostridia bacterium]
MKGKRFAEKTADILRAFAGKEKHKPTAAVIAAGGDSSRMQGINKQFVEIDGVPTLARSIQAFEDAECIKEIVVVTRKDDIPALIGLCEKYKFKKVIAVVPGGASRQESVWLGFSEISDSSEFVAIHDGARCLVTSDMIERVCREAYIYRAATAANRVSDTVKRTEKGGFVEETLDRNHVWVAQTPQVFDSNLYRAAAYTAKESGFNGTDDCSLVENIDFKAIRLVECGRENIKLTTPDDLAFAKAILSARKDRQS